MLFTLHYIFMFTLKHSVEMWAKTFLNLVSLTFLLKILSLAHVASNGVEVWVYIAIWYVC